MKFVEVAKTTDIPLGKACMYQVEDKAIAIFNVDNKFYATEEMCPHRAGPLHEGKLVGKIITCPWHKAHFDVTTGTKLGGAANRDLKCYGVKVDGERILIEV